MINKGHLLDSLRQNIINDNTWGLTPAQINWELDLFSKLMD
jgi:hypothetical protein